MTDRTYITEDIRKWLRFTTKTPKPTIDKYLQFTDTIRDSLQSMEEYISTIEDDNLRGIIRKNINMMYNLLVENISTFNDYMNKKEKLL